MWFPKWSKVVGIAFTILSTITIPAYSQTTPTPSCLEYGDMQLCEYRGMGHVMALRSEMICPENHHICDLGDQDELMIFQNEYASRLTNECYATRISDVRDGECSSCLGRDIKNDNMIMIGSCPAPFQATRTLKNDKITRSRRLEIRNVDEINAITIASTCCEQPIEKQNICYDIENSMILERFGLECFIENNKRYCGIQSELINEICNNRNVEYPACAGGFSVDLKICDSGRNNSTDMRPSVSPIPSKFEIPSPSPSASVSSKPDTRSGGEEPAVTAHPSETPRPDFGRGEEPTMTAKPSATPAPSASVSSKPDTRDREEPTVTAHPSATPAPSKIAVPSPSPSSSVSSKPDTRSGGEEPAVTAHPSETPRPDFGRGEEPTMTAKPSATPAPSRISVPSITPRPSYTPALRYCEYKGRRFPNMWTGMVDSCTLCRCMNSKMECQARCGDRDDSSSGENSELTDDEINEDPTRNQVTEVQSCLHMPRNYFSDVNRFRCIKQTFMKGFACCRDKNICDIENCASCERGICIDCKRGYSLIFDEDNTKCVSRETPSTPICRENQIERVVNGRSYCRDCINGRVEGDECVCNQDFIGDMCQINCRRSLCSGHGTCDLEERKCVCDDTYGGRQCNIRKDVELRCEHGIYNDAESKCECNYGFKGRLCQEKIPCMNGEIIEERCICENGYSGRDCSIRRPEPPSRIRENLLLKNRTETDNTRKSCRHGFNINGECYCHLGWGGESCDELMCRHGLMNITSQECMCSNGWSGEKCDISCSNPCNNKGSICNENRVCECRNNWSGEYCENKRILNRTSIISISDFEVQIIKDIVEENKDIQMKLIECLDFSCLPFEINIKDLGNVSQPRFLRGRMNQESGSMDVVLDPELIPVNKSVFVYEKNNVNNNNTFEDNVITIDTTKESDYLFTLVSRQIEVSSLVDNTDNVQPENPINDQTPTLQPSPSSSPEINPGTSPSGDNLSDESGTNGENGENPINENSNDNDSLSSNDNILTSNPIISSIAGFGALIAFAGIGYLARRQLYNKEKTQKKESNTDQKGEDTVNPLYKK
jgi:hypothetical protein